MTITTPDARLMELQQLASAARTLDISDDEAFVRLIAACGRTLELTDQQIADSLGVSRPTVNRWSRGVNLPHRLMRNPIAQWIADAALERTRLRTRGAGSRAMA
jgi:DNA-binding MurR/RpiR family transcriptional regulator